MNKIFLIMLITLIGAISVSYGMATKIKKNKKKLNIAPDFKLQDETGTFRTLEEFKGKKVVLYFYPKDDTPNCTKEACSFRDSLIDNSSLYKKYNIIVIGISFDSPKSHAKFKEKYNLPFILLSDTDHKVASKYGADKGLSGYLAPNRVTFLIDEQGQIVKKLENINVSQHAQDVLKEFNLK